jgi:hypothetical protein
MQPEALIKAREPGGRRADVAPVSGLFIHRRRQA